MSVTSRAIEFLGLKRGIVGLLGMGMLVELGEKMARRFLPIYLMALGGGPLAIGLLNGVDNLLGALYAFPGGYAAERWGAKRALLFFNILAIFGYAIALSSPTWQAVILGAFFFIAWTAISLPATASLVARILPNNKRTMGISMHSLVRRVPMALGPLLGGVLVDRYGEANGVRIAFGIAIVLALVAILIQQTMISDADATPIAKPEKNVFKMFSLITPNLRPLLVSDILIRFTEQIPFAFVVVWAMKEISSPVTATEFGVLTAIEMATAVACYIPVAYLADKTTKKPFVVITFLFFTIFPLVLYYSHSFWPLVVAFMVRGLKEFGEPTRKALILDLALPGREAATFGVYYLIRDTIVSLAAFGGALLWMISPATNFFAAVAFGLFGTIWFLKYGLEPERPVVRSVK